MMVTKGEGALVERFSTTSFQVPVRLSPSAWPIMPLRLATTILPRFSVSSGDFSSEGSITIRMRRLSTTSAMSISPNGVMKMNP